jgi:uncharacterized protein YbjT (DUF2867 family)
MRIKLIVTGASGMVGEGVLIECLQREDVGEVLVVGRHHCGMTHPKLKEVLHEDFYDLSPIAAQLSGYDGCLFCLGTTSLGKDEETYTNVTYKLTIHFAETVAAQNSSITFCYVSGAGTDSAEQGNVMWARVKGKTENTLVKLFPGMAYNFRPGIMKPTPGMKNTLNFYKYFGWLYPIVHTLSPSKACTLAELGQAMINAVNKGYKKSTLEVTDIVQLARQN